jgi:hypothetical protein
MEATSTYTFTQFFVELFFLLIIPITLTIEKTYWKDMDEKAKQLSEKNKTPYNKKKLTFFEKLESLARSFVTACIIYLFFVGVIVVLYKLWYAAYVVGK